MINVDISENDDYIVLQCGVRGPRLVAESSARGGFFNLKKTCCVAVAVLQMLKKRKSELDRLAMECPGLHWLSSAGSDTSDRENITENVVRRPQQHSPAGPASDSELDLLDGGSSQDYENIVQVPRWHKHNPTLNRRQIQY